MHKQTNHRSETHCHVVCQSVVTDSFSSSRRRQNINDQCVSGNSNHSECNTMDDTQCNEQCYGGGKNISPKHSNKHKISNKIKRTARECIQQITGKRPDAQTCHSITGQYKSYPSLICPKLFLQIECHNRHNQVECKIQQKIFPGYFSAPFQVTVQTGLRIYCADRTKTYRQEASGPSRSDWNGRMPLLFCRRLNSNYFFLSKMV